MARMSDDWYREQAVNVVQRNRKVLGPLKDNTVEVQEHAVVEPGAGPKHPGVFRDETPTVSRSTNPGAWVMLWVWIPDPPEVLVDGESKEAEAH